VQGHILTVVVITCNADVIVFRSAKVSSDSQRDRDDVQNKLNGWLRMTDLTGRGTRVHPGTEQMIKDRAPKEPWWLAHKETNPVIYRDAIYIGRGSQNKCSQEAPKGSSKFACKIKPAACNNKQHRLRSEAQPRM
jgi:hypothetical protein